MRILLGHNRYKQRGGEDVVFEDEMDLLRAFGDEVVPYERTNEEILQHSNLKKIQHFAQLDFSKRSFDELKQLIEKDKPDVAHFHNTFFMMTPAVYDVCKEQGIAVVQSLHNFRLFCANALFYRDGHVCEDCINKTLLEGIKHRCYKKSFLLTAFIANMISKLKKKMTWTDKVDLFITGTEFTKVKLVEAGLPEDKIRVKPNFVLHDPGEGSHQGDFALYVGRLSEEKGADVLVEAWKDLEGIPLKVVGEGPLFNTLRERTENLEHIEMLGYASNEQYDDLMKRASFMVIPSVCYENFPRIIVEAYSYGLPVVTSKLGSLGELTIDGVTGLHFEAGNKDDLVSKVRDLLKDQQRLAGMRANSRKEFDLKFNKHENYKQVRSIYNEAIEIKTNK